MRRVLSCRPFLLLAPILIPFLAGCGGTHPGAGPLLLEFHRYERDAEPLHPVPPAEEALRAGQAKRDEARPLVEKGKDERAVPLLEAAVADARTALATAQADEASREADGCLRAAERTRRAWDEALGRLIETEQVARRAAAGVPHEPPAAAGMNPPDLPPTTWDGGGPPIGQGADLSAAWKPWHDRALADGIPTADLEGRFESHVQASGQGSRVEQAHHLYLAGRVLQELEARVRRETSQRLCSHSTEFMAQLGEATQQALLGTLELEGSLKDDLRAELEKTRAEAENRQNQLYESLQQIQGKFAQISRDARGTVVSLADILFDFDKATLKRDVEFNLVRVATILNQFPEMKITVEGHTDNVGKPEYNLDLSRRRAQAVHDFLAAQGVTAERMTVEGYGMTRPVADNATEEGRRKNRRVDLVIQDQP